MAGVAGCGASGTPAPVDTGARVELAVAPLSLSGVGVACYDVAVTAGPTGSSETVWARGDVALTRLGHDQTAPPDPDLPAVTTPGSFDAETLCSDAYGAGGSVAYVGPCDASAGADTDPSRAGVQNTVTLWVDGLYDAGATSELGHWQDPCASGCVQQIDCDDNSDSPASFELSIMRAAQQGFFDIAVNFDNIFCSAKLDTCYGADPIRLLFGADGQRDWTAVFGFACTAGTGDADTTLYYGAMAVECGDTTYVIDPLGPNGNNSASAGGSTLHYGIYRGVEQLSCDDPSTTEVTESCNKAYWNLALSLDDLAATGETCTLAFSATATDGDTAFTDGLPANSLSYPYIDVDATLTTSGSGASCQENALDDGGAVATAYHGTNPGALAFAPMCSFADGDGTGATSGLGCPGSVPEVDCPCWTLSDLLALTEAITAGGPSTYEMDYSVYNSGDDSQTDAYAWDQTFTNYFQASASFMGGVAGCTYEATANGESAGYVNLSDLSTEQYDACLQEMGIAVDNGCLNDNGGCSGATATCVYDGPGLSSCVECAADADCAGNEAGDTCDYQQNVCVVGWTYRAFNTATRLDDGTVALIGGIGDGNQYVTDVEIVHPDSFGIAQRSLADPLPGGRRDFTATRLSDGRVLVAGGDISNTHLSSALLFDPAAAPGSQWTATPDMPAALYLHAATLLADGRVLVTGGMGTFSGVSTAYLYDPTTNSWSSAASMAGGHRSHTATRLQDGRVIVVGSNSQQGADVATSVEIYDPIANSWSTAAPLTSSRERHTATLLGDGTVLITGGYDYPRGAQYEGRLVQRYDPATNAWSDLTPLGEERTSHTATLLDDGTVLLVGGRGATNGDKATTTEIYDPSSGPSATDPIPGTRYSHGAVLLGDGRVVVGGGYQAGSHMVEIYDPSAPAGSRWTP